MSKAYIEIEFFHAQCHANCAFRHRKKKSQRLFCKLFKEYLSECVGAWRCDQCLELTKELKTND
jgi:hypothetical protein